VTVGGILTAMVTPFGPDGEVSEETAVGLMRHLLDNGSDGLVLTATTGESPTLSDDEMARLWELGVGEFGHEATIVAGTGSNNTRHAVELAERATEIGVDAMISVTPYYNKPNRRGLIEHYRAIDSATDKPIVLYNIPSRTVIDVPNDVLRELAEIPNVSAVKQARYEDLEAIEGLDLLAGNDDMLADVLDAGGTGGVLVSSHLVGREMRRMIDEPENRREIHESLADLFKAVFVATSPIGIKAALNMVGHDVGAPRLPLVEASEEEKAVVREALEHHGLLAAV
jgi:4-hydroxy-tetrahydrodipicolinate synthase